MFLYTCMFFYPMRRKERIIISLGTIMCIVILSLPPTISAVGSQCQQQNKTLQSKKIITKGVHDQFLQGALYRIKHPILYFIVTSHLLLRAARGDYLVGISVRHYDAFLIHPILYYRGFWLLMTADSMCDFWNAVSGNWNWPYLSVWSS